MRVLFPVAFGAILALTTAARAEPPAATHTTWLLPRAEAQVETDAAPHPLQGIRGPTIAPDGTKIVFGAVGDLWTVDLDPKNWTPGKPPKGKHFTKDEFVEFDPAWSPDGTQFAFISDRGGKMEIWLHEMKTNRDRQLTTMVEAAEAPSWSPDSNRIAFYKVSSTGDRSVRTLSIATVFTGDVRDIRAGIEALAPPAWARDGETLALKVPGADAGHPSAKFLLLSLKGRPDRFVVPDGGLSPILKRGDGPAWSPDGTKLAYVDVGTLHILPVVAKGAHIGEAAGPAQVPTHEIADSPHWSGDSKSVVFVATDRIKRVALDGTLTDLQPNLTWKRNVPPGQTVVWAGRLWDGVGNGYRENVDIVIDGNVITAVEPHRSRDARTRLVNASHMAVVPGLIDSHATLTSVGGERLGRLLLSFGVTTVRDWGTDPYDALERRESWSSGRRDGPRELFNAIVVDEKQAAAEAERAKRLGYDIALDQNPGDPSARAVTFGIGPDVKPGAIVIPEFAAAGGFAAVLARGTDLIDHGQIDDLYTDDEQAALKAAFTPAAATLSALERNVGTAQTALRTFTARGGTFVPGSGAPSVPYGVGFLVECELAQQAGLSPLQVLRAATMGAATAAGIDKQVGTIEAGKLADMAIVDGDPLKQVADMGKITGVLADGHYYIIDELLRH